MSQQALPSSQPQLKRRKNTKRTPAAVVQRLQTQADQESQSLLASSQLFGDLVSAAADHDDDDTESSVSPILDRFILEMGSGDPALADRALRTMTNMTVVEFNTLWQIVEEALVVKWNVGRGRRSTVTPKDAFMMALCVLKHYDTWDKHAQYFNMNVATFEKMIVRVFEITSPVLFGEFVNPVTMTSQRANKKAFTNYPYALYVTDVKFQPS